MPNCRIELFDQEPGYDPVYNLGEMGHIAGSSGRGPRADTKLPGKDRDNYNNLILLCRNCHGRIDGLSEAFPVERLKAIKLDHEAWIRSSLPERGLTVHGWSVVQIRGEYPFDASSITSALSPDHPRSEIRLDVRPGKTTWVEIKSTIRRAVENLTSASDPDLARFAIFPLAPVSACIFFGYVLTSRVNTKAFQYHRDAASWCWSKDVEGAESVSVSIPIKAESLEAQVCFVFALSANVDIEAVSATIVGEKTIYVLGVEHPTTSWLQERGQLAELGLKTRETFERAAERHPKSTLWHIYYAGPAPGAIVVGQQMNPTMVPPVQLYEFLRPDHTASILIQSTDSRFGDWRLRAHA